MILSNLITAKSLDENPAIHASSKIKNIIRLLIPALLFIFDTEDFPFVPAWAIFDNQKHDTHTNGKQEVTIYSYSRPLLIGPNEWQHDTSFVCSKRWNHTDDRNVFNIVLWQGFSLNKMIIYSVGYNCHL